MGVVLALLSCTKKYNFLKAFLTISLIWIFQVKSLEILRPKNFTLRATTSKAWPLMRMGSNSRWDFVKDIRISLQLSVFSWTLFSSPRGGVLPYKGLMGTCGQPGYVFRDFCLKQGIEFIIFCLNQGIDLSIFVLKRINVLNRVSKIGILS